MIFLILFILKLYMIIINSLFRKKKKKKKIKKKKIFFFFIFRIKFLFFIFFICNSILYSHIHTLQIESNNKKKIYLIIFVFFFTFSSIFMIKVCPNISIIRIVVHRVYFLPLNLFHCYKKFIRI